MCSTFIRLLPPLCVVFVKKINIQLSRLVIGKLYQPAGVTGNRIQVALFVLRLLILKYDIKFRAS